MQRQESKQEIELTLPLLREDKEDAKREVKEVQIDISQSDDELILEIARGIKILEKARNFRSTMDAPNREPSYRPSS